MLNIMWRFLVGALAMAILASLIMGLVLLIAVTLKFAASAFVLVIIIACLLLFAIYLLGTIIVDGV